MAYGTLSGNVKVGTEDGASASSSIIRIYERDSGILVGDVTTDIDGNFTVSGLDTLKVYTLTAINNSFPGYNAGIKDNVRPIHDPTVITLSTGMYPLIIDQDNIDLECGFLSGVCFTWPNDDIYLNTNLISAIITITVNYTTYPYFNDDIYLNSSFISGILSVTVNYVTYPYLIDDIYLNTSLISGTLTVTVNYVNYDFWPAENIYLGVSLLGATLA